MATLSQVTGKGKVICMKTLSMLIRKKFEGDFLIRRNSQSSSLMKRISIVRARSLNFLPLPQLHIETFRVVV